MNASLFVKCLCPSCFEEIFLGECKIVSGRTSGVVLKDPGKGPFARMHVEPLDGRLYARELAHRQCPKCNYLLPPNIEQVPNLIFVVVGDVHSGKSHYIAALIHQIKEEWIANASGYARFLCLTPEREKEYTREYFDPLFGHNQIIQRTAPKTDLPRPLVYNLVSSRSANHPPVAVNLMIYDTSGEDFEELEKLVEVARFTLHTNAFVFVVDPFTITPLIQQLPPHLKILLQSNIQRARGRRAADRLSSVIDIVERYRGIPFGASLHDTPVAVMITKSDIFESAIPSHNFYFQKAPTYGDGIDLKDIDAVDYEVKELLKAYGQGALLAATRRFRRLKFFATSATGTPPDAQGNFPYVRPHRCLDPILWIMYELKIINSNI